MQGEPAREIAQSLGQLSQGDYEKYAKEIRRKGFNHLMEKLRSSNADKGVQRDEISATLLQPEPPVDSAERQNNLCQTGQDSNTLNPARLPSDLIIALNALNQEDQAHYSVRIRAAASPTGSNHGPANKDRTDRTESRSVPVPAPNPPPQPRPLPPDVDANEAHRIYKIYLMKRGTDPDSTFQLHGVVFEDCDTIDISDVEDLERNKAGYQIRDPDGKSRRCMENHWAAGHSCDMNGHTCVRLSTRSSLRLENLHRYNVHDRSKPLKIELLTENDGKRTWTPFVKVKNNNQDVKYVEYIFPRPGEY